MGRGAREVLAGIATVSHMVTAFADEERCRRVLEVLIWPRGRFAPLVGVWIR